MKKNLGNRILGASLAGLLVLLAGCATNPDGTKEYKRTAIGALGGAAVGAGAGALIGGKRAGRGALIGGVTGAVVGGAIGNYMDRQAAELKRRLPEAAVERQGGKLEVAPPPGILLAGAKDPAPPQARPPHPVGAVSPPPPGGPCNCRSLPPPAPRSRHRSVPRDRPVSPR